MGAPATTDVERERREAWRLQQFLNLAFSVEEAERLVEAQADWHQAKDLLARGCSHVLALKILL